MGLCVRSVATLSRTIRQKDRGRFVHWKAYCLAPTVCCEAVALLVWDRTCHASLWWWWSACTSMLCCAVLQWQWCTRPQPLTCKIVSVSECSVSWYVADLCLLVACWCLNACVFGVPIVHCTRTGAFGGWNMAVDVPCLLLGLGFCWFCFCTLFHYSIVDVSTGFIFVYHLDRLRVCHWSNQLWVF